ncbi:MAG: alpha/beta fold hydrolase, partial [Gemmatimonadetes bacterium]|nr:alpha/beta fold hydrolase [Gemmatimonadota bacterium]
MKIKTVEYAGTVATSDQAAPGELPQVAFSGRSNVGKSSLINTLLRRTRSKIAHVSTTPGKTQALNFYRVNEHFFLVDLPGFGDSDKPVGSYTPSMFCRWVAALLDELGIERCHLLGHSLGGRVALEVGF